MESLYLLIPVSLIFCAIAVAIFFWAVNSGQYEDLDGEGQRILFDETPKNKDVETEQDSSLQPSDPEEGPGDDG